MSVDNYLLFLDEPTDIDLLSFAAVAGTVVDALLDPRIDPIALAHSGIWGSRIELRMQRVELWRNFRNFVKDAGIEGLLATEWRTSLRGGARP